MGKGMFEKGEIVLLFSGFTLFEAPLSNTRWNYSSWFHHFQELSNWSWKIVFWNFLQYNFHNPHPIQCLILFYSSDSHLTLGPSLSLFAQDLCHSPRPSRRNRCSAEKEFCGYLSSHLLVPTGALCNTIYQVNIFWSFKYLGIIWNINETRRKYI